MSDPLVQEATAYAEQVQQFARLRWESSEMLVMVSPCRCGHQTPCLEELSDDAGGGWRICCYVCHRQTENGLHLSPILAALDWYDNPRDVPIARSHEPRADE